MKRLKLAVLITCLAACAAHADALSDCTQNRNAPLKLRACSEVIAKPDFKAEDKARAFRARGNLRVDAGAASQAVVDFDEALKLLPNDAPSYAGRAKARVAMGQPAAALADYGEAIRLQPENTSYFLGRGHVHFLRGNAQAAIADFTEVLRLNPRSATAYNQRGLAYRRSGDLTRALEDYTAAIGINPVYALAYNNRGYAYEALGRKADAIADFKAALMLDASLVGARDGLARLGAPGASLAETEQRIREGRALVTTYCVGCHAVGPTGDSPNPKAPPFRSLSDRHPGVSLREPLSRGIAAPHDVMPKFELTPGQVDTIIAYINSLTAKPAAPAARTWRTQVSSDTSEIGDARKGLAYAGKACAQCHTVTGADTPSPNPKAPRFRQIANTPGMTVTALTVWSRTTHATMPNLVIAPSDMDDLIAYILSLKSRP